MFLWKKEGTCLNYSYYPFLSAGMVRSGDGAGKLSVPWRLPNLDYSRKGPSGLAICVAGVFF